MAKQSTKRVVRINPSSLATFQGVFWSILGLGVAILRSLEASVDIANSTDSLLNGMVFGMAAGMVSIIVVPLIYFGFGWLIGYLQGWVFNVVLGASGGLLFDQEDE